MRAALVASARSRGGCTAAIRSCSALVAYRSWLVTPWSIQTACCGIVIEPTLTSRRLAVAKDGPRILSNLSIFHLPVAPARKAARTIQEAFVPRAMIGPPCGLNLPADRRRCVHYIVFD